MRRYKFIPQLLVVVIIASFFVMPHFASAQGAETTEGCGGWILHPIDCTFITFKGILANILETLVDSLNSALSVPIANQPVVRESWGIVREFANMFFIIALIIMAFATIFNVAKYNFSTLIVRFLIAALLINFSLVIGEIIIDISQSLATVFLQSIGNIGDHIGQGVQIANTFVSNNSNTSGPVDSNLWSETMANAINIVLLLILLFSIGILWFFLVIRIPILWALLIVAPLAWILYILPTTNRYSRMWWNYFMSWNMFLPIYLFFIYFGVLFLSRQNQVLTGVSSGTSSLGFTFQSLFYFVMVAIFLIGGAKVAIGMSMAGGAGAVAGAIRTRSWAATRYGGKLARTGVIRGVTRGRYGYDDVSSATQARIQQAKKEGVFGIGGSEAAARRQAKLSQAFGVRDAAQDRLAKDIANEKAKLRTITDPEKLKELATAEKTDYKKLAYLERLDEIQGLSSDQVIEAFNLYGGAGSKNAVEFIRKVDPKRFSKTDRDKLYEEVNDIRFKQKIADVRAELGEFSDPQDFLKQLTLYTSDGDTVNAIRKAKDFRGQLTKQERKEVFEKFAGRNEVQKELAGLMIEKGDFDAAELENAVKNLYATDPERERVLRSAQGKMLMTSLKVQAALNLLPKKDDGTRPSYEEARSFQFSRLSAGDLLKVKASEFKGADGKLSDEVKEELKERAKRNAKFITNLTTNKDFTGEYAALMGDFLDELSIEVAKERAAKSRAQRAKETGKSSSGDRGGRSQPISGGPPPSGIILPPGAQFEINKSNTEELAKIQAKINQLENSLNSVPEDQKDKIQKEIDALFKEKTRIQNQTK